MGQVKYETTVIGLGEIVQEFINDGILVFFGKQAPEELQEAAVVTEHESQPTAPVVPGDTVHIGEHAFEILAVGEVANENLKNLGHLVVKFNGLGEPEMKGDVCVPEMEIPEVTPGMKISITGA